jgi:EmrB/QacA subfamily drug resistance transporter
MLKSETPDPQSDILPSSGDAMAECTAPPVGAGSSRADRPNRLLPLIIGASLFMQTLDSTVISNALPTMARSLHEHPVTLNLAITSYLLATAIFLPISAWMADRFGARRVFRASIIGFALSSLMCGLSHNLPELIAARMVQGVAGAMMIPVGRLVLLRSVPKSQLVSAMSFLTVPALLGPILGPPIGGFIVTYMSWRWIFFINVPIGVLGVILTTLFIPDIREEVREKLDLKGFLLTAGSLAGLVYGFDNLGHDTLPAAVVAGMLLIGAICGGLYVAHARRTPHAILDLSLLRIQTFTASTVGGLFSRLVIGAGPFLLALLFQLGFGLTAFEAGLLTFTSAVGALAMKATAPPIIRWFGFKRVLIANSFAVAITGASYALFKITTPHWLLVILLLTNGFFRSLQFTALNTLGYADIPPQLMSRASSVSSMFQQLAQSLGVGLAAILIHYTIIWRNSPSLAAADITPAFAIVAALSLIALFYYVRLPADAGAELSGREA